MSEIKQPYLLNPVRYFVQLLQDFSDLLLTFIDRRMNIDIIHGIKSALARSGIFLCLSYKSVSVLSYGSSVLAVHLQITK